MTPNLGAGLIRTTHLGVEGDGERCIDRFQPPADTISIQS